MKTTPTRPLACRCSANRCRQRSRLQAKAQLSQKSVHNESLVRLQEETARIHTKCQNRSIRNILYFICYNHITYNIYPPTRVGVHSFFSYVGSKILSQGAHPKSPVQNPKSKIPKIQNPKSPKSKVQNPKSPNSKIQTLHIKICYIMFQKSKIQNPQNPKSPKSKIQSPKSPQSKIQNPQNPQNPKSKIPKIQNPKSPKSKIQAFLAGFWRFWGFWILDFGDFGFWIWDSGPKIQNPNSPKSKIQNPKSPKSKIPKIQNPQNPQNPKSKIPKIQNPKSSAKIQNLGRWGPHVKNCYITIQNPKSKIPKIRPKKFGFWILGILDFGFWGFWILDFWDFGDLGFWILGVQGMYH